MGYKIEDIIIEEVEFIFGSFLPVVKSGHFMLLAKWTKREESSRIYFFLFQFFMISFQYTTSFEFIDYAIRMSSKSNPGMAQFSKII